MLGDVRRAAKAAEDAAPAEAPAAAAAAPEAETAPAPRVRADIPDTLRREALKAGVDPDAAAEGAGTRRGASAQVRRAVARRNKPDDAGNPQPRTSDDYVRRLQQGAGVVLQRASQAEAGSIDDVMIIARQLAKTDEFKEFGDDLAVYIDEMIVDAKRRGELVDDTETVDIASVPLPIRNRAKAIAKSMKAEDPDLEDDVAMKLALEKAIRTAKPEAGRSLTRSSGDRAVKAGIMTTAGRNANGTIQTFLRKGIAIAKGSDYAIGADAEYPMAHQLSQQAATLEAKKSGGVVSFVARGGEYYTPPGQGRGNKGRSRNSASAEKGQILYTDADGYVSNEEGWVRALNQKRHQYKPGEVKTSKAAALNVPEEDADLSPKKSKLAKIAEVAGDDAEKLNRILKAEAEGRKSAEMIPATDGENIAIIRKIGTNKIRMLSPSQIKAGKGVDALIGSADPAEWEVRYAPPGNYARTPEALAKTWKMLDNVETKKADEVLDDAPATPEEAFTPDGPEPKTLDEVVDLDVTLSADEWAMVIEAGGFGGLDPKSLGGKPIRLGSALEAIHKIESRQWSVGKGKSPAPALQVLYTKLTAVVPEGIMLPNATRAEAREAVLNIFEKYSADEAAEAARLIDRLAGGDVAPNLRETRNGAGSGYVRNFSSDPEWRDQAVKLDFTQKLQGGDAPRLAHLYHEVAHWAYFNILKDSDRLEFWRIAEKYQSDPKAREGKAVRPSGFTGAQEMFAQQFEAWVTRRGDTMMADESYWKKVVSYVKAIFDRYVRGADIDPELEVLFAKILPDEVQGKARKPRDRQPTTEAGKIAYSRLSEVRLMRKTFDDAIERQSDEGVINATLELRRMLRSIGQSSKKGTGGLKMVQGSWKLIHDRLRDTTSALRIKATDEEFSDAVAELDSTLNTENLLAQSEDMVKLYLNGKDGKGTGDDASIDALLDILENDLLIAYRNSEGGKNPPGAFTASARDRLAMRTDAEGNRTMPSSMVKRLKAKQKRLRNFTIQSAERNAATPAKDRTAAVATHVPGDDATPLHELSLPELIAFYRENRKTDVGAQAAKRLVDAMRAVPVKTIGKPDAKLTKMSTPQVERELLEALYEGSDPQRIANAQSLLAKRHAKATLKVSEEKVGKAIEQEIEDNFGVAETDSVPPSARAQIREAVTYFTHRDPKTQHVLRTMAYRMFNLMGRTAKATADDANLLSMEDIQRLVGIDPVAGAGGLFADFRDPAFSHLRSDLRRMSIGLTKGGSDPLDLMHEIGHMIVASGAIPKVELDSITEAFRLARDDIRSGVFKAYGPKWAERSPAERERRLAEEWFSESLAKYMAERIGRGDIYKQIVNGDFESVEMRGAFDRAIDRAIEYVAYVVNGLIGRNSVKQQFRRITFYGDMFSAPSQAPAGRAKRAYVPSSLAANYAADTLKSSPKVRQDLVKRYVGNGYGANDNGMPITFYHGTPNASAFDRATNPDMAVRMSKTGNYGPGFYVTADPRPADEVYSKRPTPEAMRQRIEEQNPNLSEAELEDVYDDLMRLHATRRQITDLRTEYADKLMQAEFGDEVSKLLALEDLEPLADEIIDLHSFERDLSEAMAEMGATVEPLVAPVHIRMLRPADFRRSAEIDIEGPLATELASRLGVTLREGGNGAAFYTSLVNALVSQKRKSVASAKTAINNALEEAGYDGMLTTHANAVSVDGSTQIPELGSLAAQRIEHTVPVLFKANQVKHIEASDFNPKDDALYHRRPDIMPREMNSLVIESLMNGDVDSMDQIVASSFGGAVQETGGGGKLASAVSKIARRKPLTPREQKAMMDRGPKGWLRSQSSQMKQMGLNWLADWYEPHFADVHQTFGGKVMPIQKALRDLPGGESAMRGWARRASGEIGQPPNEVHSRILSALRRSSGSRQEKMLKPGERQVYRQIRALIQNERKELVKRGVWMGNRGEDYFPQLWSKARITKSASEFKAGMAEYAKIEAEARGEVIDDTGAMEFAERMYLRLASEDSDGVFIPQSGSSRNPQAENVDFGRMIELDKHPAALARLEKFLEPDLMGSLVKYFEGTSRRAKYIEKMGMSSHAFYDYMRVVDQGAGGIGELLSSDKVFAKAFQALDDNGDVTDVRLTDVAKMPFDNIGQATEFGKQLIAVHAEQGSGAARAMLMDLGTKAPSGKPSLTFARRADAIIGALDDFKGAKSGLKNPDFHWLEDAMRVAMRKQRWNTSENTRKFSNAARTFNSVTLLGFTTLSSLGDTVLPLIRSGNMKAYTTAIAKFAKDPEYRDMIRNTGVAVESLLHDRMAHMYGAADSKLTNAFFNATLLTPWTDMNRSVAGAVGYEALKAEQLRAIRYSGDKNSRQYKTAARFLRAYGLQDFLPDGPRGRESLSNKALLEGDEVVRTAVLRFTDKAVFSPNPNDIPLWAQSPVGAMLFQFKSFPLLMGKMGVDVVKEARQGNLTPFIYFMTFGPASGAAALSTKDVVQMRGGEDGESAELRKRNILKWLGYDEEVHGNEDDFLGWYVEGMMQMGGLGLVGDIAYGLADQVDNGAYGKVRTTGLIFGPTAGTAYATIDVAAGGVDAGLGLTPESNAKERSAVRELASRIPVAGAVRSVRGAIVDGLAGGAKEDESGWKWGVK